MALIKSVALGIFVLALVIRGGLARGGDAPVKTSSIRGIVKDRQGKPLSWVQVWCDEGHRSAQETGADGSFRFEGVAVVPCTVTATLLGTPTSGPSPDVKKLVTPSEDELILVVDRGAELVVRVEGTRFPGAETTQPLGVPTSETGGVRVRLSGAGFFTSESMSFGSTRLYVKTAKGWDAWFPAVDDGALAFRRLPVAVPWTLFIAWSESTKGTYLGAGEALKAGIQTVALEPGKPIVGTAKLPPPPRVWAGPPRDTVRAVRGPVVVPGWVDDRLGTFGFPPLPAGLWSVTLTSGGEQAVVNAEAGATLSLEPK
jgi:hypothetical protein